MTIMTANEKSVAPQIEPMSRTKFADHGRAMVVHHGERILGEIPQLLRRVGLFFVVMAVSVPIFFVGLLVVLWHLGH
jgi:hypothetical protein